MSKQRKTETDSVAEIDDAGGSEDTSTIKEKALDDDTASAP